MGLLADLATWMNSSRVGIWNLSSKLGSLNEYLCLARMVLSSSRVRSTVKTSVIVFAKPFTGLCMWYVFCFSRSVGFSQILVVSFNQLSCRQTSLRSFVTQTSHSIKSAPSLIACLEKWEIEDGNKNYNINLHQGCTQEELQQLAD